jgi:hypothetical protein
MMGGVSPETYCVVGGRCQAQHVPVMVHQLHVQHPSTYEISVAHRAGLGS